MSQRPSQRTSEPPYARSSPSPHLDRRKHHERNQPRCPVRQAQSARLQVHRERHRLLQDARQPVCRAGALDRAARADAGHRPRGASCATTRSTPSALARDITTALDRLPRGSTAISDFSEHIEDSIERAWVYGTLMFGQAQVRTGYPDARHAEDEDACTTRCYRSRASSTSIKADDLADNFVKLCGATQEAHARCAGRLGSRRRRRRRARHRPAARWRRRRWASRRR